MSLVCSRSDCCGNVETPSFHRGGGFCSWHSRSVEVYVLIDGIVRVDRNRRWARVPRRGLRLVDGDSEVVLFAAHGLISGGLCRYRAGCVPGEQCGPCCGELGLRRGRSDVGTALPRSAMRRNAGAGCRIDRVSLSVVGLHLPTIFLQQHHYRQRTSGTQAILTTSCFCHSALIFSQHHPDAVAVTSTSLSSAR